MSNCVISQAVVVLAEELNFTRAAHRLHVTQPALSFQITEVEKLNGIQLFARVRVERLN